MRKLRVYRVHVQNESDQHWEQTFIGRPSSIEVAEAIEIDRTEALNKAKPLKINGINRVYDAFITLVSGHGVPNGALTTCTYADVKVGQIEVSEVSRIVDRSAAE